VFEEFQDLPLHPLAVHPAVVLVPLLVVIALAYALVPRLRAHVGWVAVVLSVIAPIAAVVAVLSGNALQQRSGLPLEGDLAEHRDLGTITMWVTIGLGVVTLALVLTRARAARSGARAWLTGGLTVLVVVAAAVTAVYVFLTGDAGSRMVWEGR
jgi:uncharacterized membrane protein